MKSIELMCRFAFFNLLSFFDDIWRKHDGITRQTAVYLSTNNHPTIQPTAAITANMQTL